MRITYTEKNGRKYAYMCTSKRVHGKRNPVSERTYVGVVDSCTGRIIPKKGTSAVPLPENGIRIKSHGDVAIVMSILDRLGIRKDLESAFGERGDIILAIAAAQAVRPSKTDMVEHTLRSSTICDMLDLRTSDFTLKSIKSVINSISSDEVGSYFVTRHARFPGRIIVFSFTNSLTDGIGAPIKRLLGHPVDDSMAIALMMTESGNPIGFAQIHEPSQDISDLVSILERVRDSVSESTFVSDTFSAPSLRFTELLMRGLDIVLPFSVISAQYHSMESAFGEVISPENEIQLSRGTLYMKEGRAGVCLGRQGYTFVPPDDDRFPQCGQCMRAFISYDSRINTSTVSAMETIVCNTKARLNGIPSDDPEFDLRRTAGALSDIMKVSKDRDGFMKVTARRDKVEEFKRNAGRSLVLTTSASWEDVSTYRTIRIDMADAVRQYYQGSDWVMRYVGRGVSMNNHLFVEFIAICVYHEMQSILKEHRLRMSVVDALHLASSLRVVELPCGNVRSTVDRPSRELFQAFGVDIDDIP